MLPHVRLRTAAGELERRIAKLLETNIRVSPSIKFRIRKMEQDEILDVLVQASQQNEKTVAGIDDDKLDVSVEASKMVADIDDDDDDKIYIEASQQYKKFVADIDDDDDDKVYIEASQQYEKMVADNDDKASNEYESRFGNPVTNETLDSIKRSAIPMKTRQSTLWAVNVWKAWAKQRKCIEDDEKKYLLYDNILDMSVESLSFWLSKFVIEVRKENGEEYPPDSIYSICCGLQRHLRTNGREEVNAFGDYQFATFRQVLDGQMKLLKSSGGFEKKQAGVITEEIEEKLWDLGLLGSHNPQALVDTVFFYIGS